MFARKEHRVVGGFRQAGGSCESGQLVFGRLRIELESLQLELEVGPRRVAGCEMDIL